MLGNGQRPEDQVAAASRPCTGVIYRVYVDGDSSFSCINSLLAGLETPRLHIDFTLIVGLLDYWSGAVPCLYAMTFCMPTTVTQ